VAKFDINDDESDEHGTFVETPHPFADGKPDVAPPGPDQTAVQVQADQPVRPQPQVPTPSVVRKLNFGGVPMAPMRSVKPNINTLIYGRPGSGKTYLTATAQKSPIMKDMLYISAEAGSSTIKQVDPSIMIIPDPNVRGSINWDEFEAVYDELDRQCYNTKDGCEFRTVAVDTGTELQKINMEWVMKGTLAAHPDRDPDVPGLHDWGKSSNRMRSMVRRFRDLPVNFIFVCHEMEDRDNKGLLWKKPSLPGKFANEAAAFFDQVMYLYTKQQTKGDEKEATDIVRVLMTGALEGYVTKDRSGNLPLLMVNPNMDKIFTLITKD
jgi:hypothetical protein